MYNFINTSFYQVAEIFFVTFSFDFSFFPCEIVLNDNFKKKNNIIFNNIYIIYNHILYQD